MAQFFEARIDAEDFVKTLSLAILRGQPLGFSKILERCQREVKSKCPFWGKIEVLTTGPKTTHSSMRFSTTSSKTAQQPVCVSDPADLAALELNASHYMQHYWPLWLLMAPVVLYFPLAGISWFLALWIVVRAIVRERARADVTSASLALSSHKLLWRVGTVRELLRGHYTSTLKLAMPAAEAFDRALASIGSIPRCRITSFDMIEGRICADRQEQASLDEIVIELQHLSLVETEIKITSRRKRGWRSWFSSLSSEGDPAGGILNIARIESALLDENPQDFSTEVFKKRRLLSLLAPAMRALNYAVVFSLVIVGLNFSVNSPGNLFWAQLQSNPEVALQTASKIAKDDYKNPYFRGLALIELKQYDKAILSLEAAEQLTKDGDYLSEILAAKARALLGQKKNYDALAVCKIITRRCTEQNSTYSPSKAKVEYSYGLVYKAFNKNEEALHCFNNSLAACEYAPVYRERAKLLQEMARLDYQFKNAADLAQDETVTRQLASAKSPRYELRAREPGAAVAEPTAPMVEPTIGDSDPKDVPIMSGLQTVAASDLIKAKQLEATGFSSGFDCFFYLIAGMSAFILFSQVQSRKRLSKADPADISNAAVILAPITPQRANSWSTNNLNPISNEHTAQSRVAARNELEGVTINLSSNSSVIVAEQTPENY